MRESEKNDEIILSGPNTRGRVTTKKKVFVQNLFHDAVQYNIMFDLIRVCSSSSTSTFYKYLEYCTTSTILECGIVRYEYSSTVLVLYEYNSTFNSSA
jgi:hypothetical protein